MSSKRNVYEIESFYPTTGHRFQPPPEQEPDPASSSTALPNPNVNFPRLPQAPSDRVPKPLGLPNEPPVDVPAVSKVDQAFMDNQAQVNCADLQWESSQCFKSWTKPYLTTECSDLVKKFRQCEAIQKELLPALDFGNPLNTIAQDRLIARKADDEGRRRMAEEEAQVREA